MSPEKPRRLGRGLEALLGSTQVSASAPASTNQNEFQRIALARIKPNPYQPRRNFSDAELQELQTSLQASGMLQPVVVRPTDHGFELISGERRLRAATRLGWQDVPALVRKADERTMLTLALIENLQRADLNSIDEARGYRRLHEDFSLTHQQIAEAVGKERSTITNVLRLLSLPEEVQQLLQQGRITMGHARALLAISDGPVVSRLAREVAADDLSVRETERRVRHLCATPEKPNVPEPIRARPSRGTIDRVSSPSAVIRQIQDRLRRHFQTDVHVHSTPDNKGTIELSFYSTDDLSRLLDLMVGAATIGD
jgi:ParB family transcriptional regulator, chromosome partitioning protein